MRHLSLLLIATLSVVPIRALSELPAEPVPNVASLPKKIPDGWLYAHDVAFFSLTSGKVFLIDPKAETRNLRAIIRAGRKRHGRACLLHGYREPRFLLCIKTALIR